MKKLLAILPLLCLLTFPGRVKAQVVVSDQTGVPILPIPGSGLSTAWSASYTYKAGDLVTYNGTLYISLTSQNVNNNPATATANWVAYPSGGGGGGGSCGTLTLNQVLFGTGTSTCGTSPNFVWNATNNQLIVSQVNTVMNADVAAGADPCAKISAASTALNGPGKIVFSSAMGTATCSASITLMAHQTLESVDDTTLNLGTNQILLHSGDEILGHGSGGCCSGFPINSAKTSGSVITSATPTVGLDGIKLDAVQINCTSNGNTAIAYNRSGISNSQTYGFSSDNCNGSGIYADSFATGSEVSTVYDDDYSPNIFAGAPGSGAIGVTFKNAANSQHIYSAHFGRMAYQMVVGVASPADVTNQDDCTNCEFEVADTQAIHIIDAFDIVLTSPRFEGNAHDILIDNVSSNHLTVSNTATGSVNQPPTYTDNNAANGGLQMTYGRTAFIAPSAAGTAPTLGGTGACASRANASGAWAGRVQCTGTTGASTVVITPGATAPTFWECDGSDGTSGTVMAQTGFSTTTCTLTGTVTANDYVTYRVVSY